MNNEYKISELESIRRSLQLTSICSEIKRHKRILAILEIIENKTSDRDSIFKLIDTEIELLEKGVKQ